MTLISCEVDCESTVGWLWTERLLTLKDVFFREFGVLNSFYKYFVHETNFISFLIKI